MVDKYRNCHKCGNPKFIFKEDELRQDDEIICVKCYIPKNPTEGWILSKVRNHPEFDMLFFANLSDARKKTYLRLTLKKIGIDLNNNGDSDAENDHRKDDR